MVLILNRFGLLMPKGFIPIGLSLKDAQKNSGIPDCCGYAHYKVVEYAKGTKSWLTLYVFGKIKSFQEMLKICAGSEKEIAFLKRNKAKNYVFDEDTGIYFSLKNNQRVVFVERK